jgi:DNA-binding response OmpR family regulator
MTIAKVLIAEDDEGLAGRLQAFFETHMADVNIVRTADAALDAMTRSCPDFLILDNDLPGRGGIETCSILNTLRCRFECVLLTSNPADRLTAAHNGINHVLVKPFEMSELESIFLLNTVAHLQLALRRSSATRAAA